MTKLVGRRSPRRDHVDVADLPHERFDRTRRGAIGLEIAERFVGVLEQHDAAAHARFSTEQAAGFVEPAGTIAQTGPADDQQTATADSRDGGRDL